MQGHSTPNPGAVGSSAPKTADDVSFVSDFLGQQIPAGSQGTWDDVIGSDADHEQKKTLLAKHTRLSTLTCKKTAIWTSSDACLTVVTAVLIVYPP